MEKQKNERPGICPAPGCGKPLIKSHGNRIYHVECAYKVKKERSINQYTKDQAKLKPCWRNDKILRDLFIKHGEHVEINPEILEELDFNFDLYEEELQVGDETVFAMTKFGYSLLKNEKIIIWKIPK